MKCYKIIYCYLEKMLKNCMTKLGFWNDDAQIVNERVDKILSDEPTGIAIEINQLNKFKEGTMIWMQKNAYLKLENYNIKFTA